MSEQAVVHSLLSELREALVFQRELGLKALDVGDTILRPKKASTASPSRSREQTVAVESNVSTAEQAREELARMLQGGSATKANTQGSPTSGEHLRGDSKNSPLDLAQSNLVLGAGNPNARLMFVGEAPRRDVELLGQPFVGQSGELLTKMIQAMGLERSDVYLTNVVKRRARKSAPEKVSPDACETVLRQQIEAVRPEVIVTFGDFASELLLGSGVALAESRGQWRESQGVAVMPTFHPDELLRDTSKKKPVWTDLQLVMHRLGLKRPS